MARSSKNPFDLKYGTNKVRKNAAKNEMKSIEDSVFSWNLSKLNSELFNLLGKVEAAYNDGDVQNFMRIMAYACHDGEDNVVVQRGVHDGSVASFNGETGDQLWVLVKSGSEVVILILSYGKDGVICNIQIRFLSQVDDADGILGGGVPTWEATKDEIKAAPRFRSSSLDIIWIS